MDRIVKMREYRKTWALRNRDRVNLKRKERRKKKKDLRLEGKHCPLCSIRLSTHVEGHSRIYCTDCYKNSYKAYRKSIKARHLGKTLPIHTFNEKRAKFKEKVYNVENDKSKSYLDYLMESDYSFRTKLSYARSFKELINN